MISYLISLIITRVNSPGEFEKTVLCFLQFGIREVKGWLGFFFLNTSWSLFIFSHIFFHYSRRCSHEAFISEAFLIFICFHSFQVTYVSIAVLYLFRIILLLSFISLYVVLLSFLHTYLGDWKWLSSGLMLSLPGENIWLNFLLITSILTDSL